MRSKWITGGLAIAAAVLLVALAVAIGAWSSAQDRVDALNADLSQATSDLTDAEERATEMEGQLTNTQAEAEDQLTEFQGQLREADSAIEEATTARGEALSFDDRRGDSDDRQVDAYEACKGFIESELVAPDTATYPDPYEDDGELTVTLMPDVDYRVRSQLESEDESGVSGRTYFACRVDYVGNDEWRLVDLTLT